MAEVTIKGRSLIKQVTESAETGSDYLTYVPLNGELVCVNADDSAYLVNGDGKNIVKECTKVGGGEKDIEIIEGEDITYPGTGTSFTIGNHTDKWNDNYKWTLIFYSDAEEGYISGPMVTSCTIYPTSLEGIQQSQFAPSVLFFDPDSSGAGQNSVYPCYCTVNLSESILSFTPFGLTYDGTAEMFLHTPNFSELGDSLYGVALGKIIIEKI